MSESESLRETLEAIVAEHHGDVALYAENLATGESVGIRADEPVQTASVIKLAILYEAIQQIRNGEAHFDDRLVMNEADKAPPSGVLLFFDTPMTLTLKDALTMMIAVSDNTATNLVIDRLGLSRINGGIAKLGLKGTHLYRKAFRAAESALPEGSKQFGLGKTTAREMATLMRKIVSCNLAEPGRPARPEDRELCEAMLYMLRSQFYRGGIPRYLGRMYTDTESAIANKTGELNAVRNDVAAIETERGTLVLAVFTWNNRDQSWSVENEGELTIAELSRAVVAEWSPRSL